MRGGYFRFKTNYLKMSFFQNLVIEKPTQKLRNWQVMHPFGFFIAFCIGKILIIPISKILNKAKIYRCILAFFWTYLWVLHLIRGYW
jgi:hypothetical protein